jgi:hypothetical protein
MREMELTPQDRAALVTYWLQQGHRFTSRDIAAAFGMTTDGARRMMGRISRVIPLVCIHTVWGMMGDGE